MTVLTRKWPDTLSKTYRTRWVSNVSKSFSLILIAEKQTSSIEMAPRTIAMTAADHVNPNEAFVIHLKLLLSYVSSKKGTDFVKWVFEFEHFEQKWVQRNTGELPLDDNLVLLLDGKWIKLNRHAIGKSWTIITDWIIDDVTIFFSITRKWGKN